MRFVVKPRRAKRVQIIQCQTCKICAGKKTWAKMFSYQNVLHIMRSMQGF